jgi:hypothetical protein
MSDFITGALIERSTEIKRGRSWPDLKYTVTLEYADREPFTFEMDSVITMTKILDELKVPARAATHILQRGGYIARLQVQP